jgi:hypothetical protein
MGPVPMCCVRQTRIGRQAALARVPVGEWLGLAHERCGFLKDSRRRAFFALTFWRESP